MHISDKVSDFLIQNGWDVSRGSAGQLFAAQKLINHYVAAGELSDGSRIVYLTVDDRGRWIERVDAFGNVVKCADLRDFRTGKDAVNAALY